MRIESDWLRRTQLRAVGATYAVVDGERIEPALYVSNPSESSFENIRFTGQEPTLFCTRTDADAAGVREGQRVEIPEEPDTVFFIADVNHDSGMANIELRKEA